MLGAGDGGQGCSCWELVMLGAGDGGQGCS